MPEETYAPRAILIPDLHPAYRAAHDIADAAYAASVVSNLAEQAQKIGFGPSAEIYHIAATVGELVGQHPTIATPWPTQQ